MYIDAAVQICSIDTLKNRLKHMKEPKVVIWDECHHIGAAGWAAIMEAWPNAYHIGLTGTPLGPNDMGMRPFFDEMVLGPSPAELIAMGSLSPYRIFAPNKPDMKGVRKAMGDYNKGDSEKKMREHKLTGDIIKHWLRCVNGLRTVGYAVNVGHSRYLVDLFNASGIPAAHLDGGSETGERKRIIQQYADGDIRVLFNVGLFGEGFDLSAWAGRQVTIDAAILANPTQSLKKYLQESMRCMRPAPNKIGIIMDHAGNSDRHGYPDDEREWSLDGQPARNAANDNAPPPPVYCTGCYMGIRRPLPQRCPNCGKQLEALEVKPIEVAEGELREVTEADKKARRQAASAEEWACRTMDDWILLGVKRGYPNPVAWARKRFKHMKPRSVAA